MKNKKLEKRVQFIFKRKSITNLTKEQMRHVKGGDGPTTEIPSTLPGCVEDKPTLNTISL
ncbi:class I lanthipeptide [Pedobacter sp. ISL-68]|uniref:class I lanthipeptide n=1 Tax=unclassified Pedobacter TaxID=2628915 RepID=UPI001BE5C840|nr:MULTISPECIES: class I lanthipeptide [unclassified Pedobacter]MBT2559781.1 class I lanthipeptide [Pedobacter sp. ISL-64]MBT2592086.1 class I lanthipeptide [Pedobacter sp. ISL-68]